MSSINTQKPGFHPIVSSLAPLTLVGGANVSPTVLKISLKLAPESVAADGGADTLRAAGQTPHAVIGDLDSVSEHSKAAFADRIHPVTTQDDTDFEKALTRITAPVILAAGFLGGRLDHTFAALNVIARHAARPVILLDEAEIAFAVQGRIDLDLAEKTPIAILPMARACVTTHGLQWNLRDQVLAPDALVSSSNAAAGGHMSIATDQPVIITLPLSALEAAITAVRAE